MGPRVLLMTTMRWPSAARLASAFAGVGADVAALFPPGHVMAGSRFLAAKHRYAALSPLTSFSRAIARSQPDLVVPCDDRALSLLLRLGPFHPVIGTSLGALEGYPALCARSIFIDAARALDLAAPETVTVGDAAALANALDRIGLPAVVKADFSWGGEGVAIARDRAQAFDAFRRFAIPPTRLRSVVRAARRHDAHFLREAIHPSPVTVSVQRYVEGRPATTAFACWQGRVLATIHMDVLETVSATGPASVMQRTDCPQMERAALGIAGRFGLSGLHGLDFIRDAAGQPHLIEINPRATQASAFALGPGHDVVAALAAAVSPVVQRVRPAATDNRLIALFPQEWRRNPQSHWLSMAFQDVPWDDPAVLHAMLAPGEPPPQLHPEAAALDFDGLPAAH